MSSDFEYRSSEEGSDLDDTSSSYDVSSSIDSSQDVTSGRVSQEVPLSVDASNEVPSTSCSLNEVPSSSGSVDEVTSSGEVSPNVPANYYLFRCTGSSTHRRCMCCAISGFEPNLVQGTDGNPVRYTPPLANAIRQTDVLQLGSLESTGGDMGVFIVSNSLRGESPTQPLHTGQLSISQTNSSITVLNIDDEIVLYHPSTATPERNKTPSTDSWTTASSGSYPFCRICRTIEVDEENKRRLISPCRCSGTVGHCHQDCLMKWLAYSNRHTCEVCQLPYIMEFKATRKFKEWKCIEMSHEEEVDIVIFGVAIFVLVASFAWFSWSSLALESRRMRFSLESYVLCGFYGAMDILCLALAGYLATTRFPRLYRRWRRVNRHVRVWEYEECVLAGIFQDPRIRPINEDDTDSTTSQPLTPSRGMRARWRLLLSRFGYRGGAQGEGPQSNPTDGPSATGRLRVGGTRVAPYDDETVLIEEEDTILLQLPQIDAAEGAGRPDHINLHEPPIDPGYDDPAEIRDTEDPTLNISPSTSDSTNLALFSTTFEKLLTICSKRRIGHNVSVEYVCHV